MLKCIADFRIQLEQISTHQIVLAVAVLAKSFRCLEIAFLELPQPDAVVHRTIWDICDHIVLRSYNHAQQAANSKF